MFLAAITGLTMLAVVREPIPSEWIMSVEICRRFPPEVEAAVAVGIIFPRRDCRWFVVNALGPGMGGEIAVWNSKEQCERAEFGLSDLFFERNRNCQEITAGGY
jgi:hypothetical protein